MSEWRVFTPDDAGTTAIESETPVAVTIEIRLFELRTGASEIRISLSPDHAAIVDELANDRPALMKRIEELVQGEMARAVSALSG